MDAIASPNHNKSIGALGGATGGGTIGILVIAFLHLRYGIILAPELSCAVGASAAAVLGTIGAFFAPLFTAGQQALIRHLNGIDRAQAEEVADAAQTLSVNRGVPNEIPGH